MAPWGPQAVFPDPAVEVIDPRFERYRLELARVQRLATGLGWAEGPVWFGDAGCLYVSDVPGDRILRWDARSGEVSTYRAPSSFANGNTRDRQGRLVTCEHLTRRVTRTEYDGSLTVLADGYDGRRLNSPNDVVVSSDGAVWFTDPAFGIVSDHEGDRAEPELPTTLYRLDAATGTLEAVRDDLRSPNGLAFSPDERTLYVVQSHARAGDDIVALAVRDGRVVGDPVPFVDAEGGTPDGLSIDEDGNLWCGWGMGSPVLDGVRVFAPDGTWIGRIRLPERCANTAFGGRRGSRLFMAAGTSVYALDVGVRGAR